ncbi:MAG: exodeoxyribonuclease III [Clostridiaceae bacterium BRH_c20a]|nr:MAG: exodeoxyribonuclease III [Clostridiaceae bacterium BRH_c20a]
MKIVSWNVNGFRACLGKGLANYFDKVDADIFCVQEIKLQEDRLSFDSPGYFQYWNYALKKGYSGTGVFSKLKPLRVTYGLGLDRHDQEGRVITLEYKDFYLVNVYTPNSQRGLARLDYRMEWEDAFRHYLISLDKEKPVIFCGDLNVAHQEIDLKNPKTNKKNAGFTEEERGKMTEILNTGFIDTFRYLYPEQEGAYTWWSYMNNARERNIGWRIDYFIASERLKAKIKDFEIHSDVLGSDHCPIALEIEV